MKELKELWIKKDSRVMYILKAHAKLKHPDTGEWVAGVWYCDLASGSPYSRTLESFLNDFEDVHEKEETNV